MTPVQPLPPIDDWARLEVRERVARVCGLRHLLADHPEKFVEALQLPFRRSAVETLSSEIIPLADACRFLERNAARLLRPRRLGSRGRPMWLWGTAAEIHRQPLGWVLIIGPGNYPLMLPGIQIVQALVAGNGVIFKPAPGSEAVSKLLVDSLIELGVPSAAIRLLDSSADAAAPYYPQVDQVILTGSNDTGQAVARHIAAHVKPAIMELSGCDAAIVLPGADLDLVVRCLRFGLWFNGSNSCIAPRRLLVHPAIADALVSKLAPALAAIEPIPLSPRTKSRLDELVHEALDHGAKLIAGRWPCADTVAPILLDDANPAMRLLQEDLGLPIASIVRVRNAAEIHAAQAACPFKLGASVFGPVREARDLARTLDVGSIVVNDLIAPTADPRLPFGGAGRSGFGVTRGAEGLLALTRPRVVQVCKRSPRFHLMPVTAQTPALLRAQLKMLHGTSAGEKFRGLKQLITLGRSAS
jgi:acyl-CoA reductase-like NAD-dependent aldehyde dehydrogenase